MDQPVQFYKERQIARKTRSDEERKAGRKRRGGVPWGEKVKGADGGCIVIKYNAFRAAIVSTACPPIVVAQCIGTETCRVTWRLQGWADGEAFTS